MKATLEFDLSDREQEHKCLRAMLADDLMIYIEQFGEWLRKVEKYGPEASIEDIREQFYDMRSGAVLACMDSWQ